MKGENWEQIESIFHQALTFQGESREKYLEAVCADNFLLLSEVNSLIASFENESSLLENPVVDLSFSIIQQKTEKKLTNTKLGFYEIQEKLGSGGMGEVYAALDTRLNRQVALKFLSESLKNDNQAKRQLRKEAQAIALLDHPNICAVHGIEEIEGENFIVMQFIEGETLEKSLETMNITRDSFKSIAKQIITAVALAHSHGIIHRDLKPGNIMVSKNGNIKVLDFGLAKVIEQQKKVGNKDSKYTSQFSQNGLVIGTISYMSPEQLRGEKLDYQTDIFSLGIIFYELLAKKNPFQHKSQAETIAAILNDNSTTSEKITPKPPAHLISLINKCLEKDKNKRFQSVAELLVEFETTENDPPSQNVSSKKRPMIIVFLSFLTIFCLSFLIFYYLSNRMPQTYPFFKPKQSLAILPIQIAPNYSEKEYLAHGLTQSLIDNLSQISGIEVKNENFVSIFKGKNVDPVEAGKTLGVDLIFTGNIYPQNNRTFLETRLIRISDNEVLDTDQLILDENKLIELQDNLSSRIVSKTNTILSVDDKNHIARKDTINPEAKKLYFNGRFYLNRRQGGDPQLAIKYFTEATNLDPSFAKAWSGLADTYSILSVPGYKGVISPAESIKLAQAAAKAALDIDDSLSEPYVSLGLIKLRYEWDWQSAENYFKTSLSHNPEYSQAYLGLAKLYIIAGRFEEALSAAKKAKDFSPFSVSADSQLATVYYFKRDYHQMSTVLQDALGKNPNHQRLRYLLGFQLLQTGKLKEATEIFEKIYGEDKLLGSAPLGLIYGKTGRHEEAQKILFDLSSLSKDSYVSAQEQAFIYLGMGQIDKVFDSLHSACQEKFSALPFLIQEPSMDEIKADPRFLEIKKCANL